jgi:CRP-like cAMP-binding protein
MERKTLSKEDRLRTVPLFGQLGHRTLGEIARIADVVDVPAGKVMVKQGGHGDQLIMILEGQARVEKNGEVINRLSQGDFFGEIALIAHRPRTATVTAEEAMRVLVVHVLQFDHLLETTPGLWKEIAVALCGYISDRD